MSLVCRDCKLEDQKMLHPDDSIKKAFKIIHKHKVRYLPVVDDNNKYLGVFTSPTLIKLLLPAAASIDLASHELEHSLSNLNFLTISDEDFRKRLDDIENEKVKHYLSDDSKIPTASPDTNIMEGIMLLHQYKRHVILVDEETNNFEGVLTINSVLDHAFNG